MKVIGRVIVAIALAAVTSTSYAGVRAFHARANNFTSGAVGGVLVPLNAAGALIVSFNLPAAGKKVLTYSAECSTDAGAGNGNAWVEIDIVVNGVTVPVTVGSADAFCTSDEEVGFGHYNRSSITVQINGIQGNNNIQIIARGINGATGIWLGDSALVVHD